ncbi:6-phospho 3-hexuloisomerase [Tetragenococcus halophilus subsp. flandriensis]|nr:6-phospho 3-hexuloisomerase [Tetragenococcus halophilus subsp. flandriensis]
MLNEILEEIANVLNNVQVHDLENAAGYITKDKRIFITGAGRSALQGKGFGMRLMHIGYKVYIVGETNTPAMREGDVLIALSGSGTTKQILHVAEKAKGLGATTIAVSTTNDSPLSFLANMTICVPGASRKDKENTSIQLLSSLFDQSVHIVLDALTLGLAHRDGTTNDFAKTMHSNIE